MIRSILVSCILLLTASSASADVPVSPYIQCPGIDVGGVGDITVNGVYGPPQPSPTACWNLCQQTSGCVFGVWTTNNGKCWPKVIAATTSPVGSYSNKVILLPGTEQCPAVGDVVPSSSYTQCAGIDVPGVGDIAVNGVYGPVVSSINACWNLCQQTAGCVFGVWTTNNGKCWPKGIAATSTSTGSYSNKVILIPSSEQCPAVGDVVPSSSYTQCAGIDVPGVGDIAVNGVYGPVVSSINACWNLCQQTAGCVFGVWTTSNEKCWPKGLAAATSSVGSYSIKVILIPTTEQCPAVGQPIA